MWLAVRRCARLSVGWAQKPAQSRPNQAWKYPAFGPINTAQRRFGKPLYQSCSCDDDFADRLRCFNELMGGSHRFDAQSLQR
jgi:hypothetical protein